MKKFPLLFAAFSLALLQSCVNNTHNDSKEAADSANEAKMHRNSAESPANTDPGNTVGVTEDDSKFAVEAANGGMAEVGLGKLAQAKGSDAQVKSFGEMMVTDHSKANDELKSISQGKNITLPTTVGQDEQKIYDDLNKKSGKDFDKAYIDAMVDDHKKDIKLFEDASQNLKDPELKAFAVKTLPTLKMHLVHCQQVQDKMN